jgi:hypothetical protein
MRSRHPPYTSTEAGSDANERFNLADTIWRAFICNWVRRPLQGVVRRLRSFCWMPSHVTHYLRRRRMKAMTSTFNPHGPAPSFYDHSEIKGILVNWF